jgi:Protein of unknown function (DUF4232)
MSARVPGNWLPGNWLPRNWLPRNWLPRNWLRSTWLSRPGGPAGAAVAAGVAAGAAVLAGCGTVQAPGSAAASGSAGVSSSVTASPSGSAGGAAGVSATASPSGSAGGAAGVSATASPSASGPATTTCASSGLRVRLDTTAAGAAAGSYYVPLDFTNTSGQACQLTGYPAVAFTSGMTGQQIGAEAAVDKSVRVTTVLLPSGGTAHAWLQVLSAANYPASKCHPVTAAGLRVVAPGSESAAYVPHPVPACKMAIQGSEILTVHPVQQGLAQRGTA